MVEELLLDRSGDVNQEQRDRRPDEDDMKVARSRANVSIDGGDDWNADPAGELRRSRFRHSGHGD